LQGLIINQDARQLDEVKIDGGFKDTYISFSRAAQTFLAKGG
jgi:hypothetical protein